MGEVWWELLCNFSDDGCIFQHRFIETPAAVLVRTALVGQVGHFILWVGFQQLITMRAGILCHREADGPDARIALHALKRYRRGGEFAQVGIAVDAGQGVIGGRGVALGTGLHGRTPKILLIACVFPEKERYDFTAFFLNKRTFHYRIP
jgi:hypothetical protein